MFDAATYIGTLADDTNRIVAIGRDEPQRPVPACGDWTMIDLAGHLSAVQRWATRAVVTRATEPFWDRDTPPAGPAAIEWLADGIAPLVEALGALDPTETIWGWAGDGRGAFWPRRQAHEAFVHRIDAELAASEPTEASSDLAADGIDEMFGVLLQAPWLQPKMAGTGETLHLHRTDGDGEWFIRLGEDGLAMAHEHAKGDVALRGGATDLLLWAWGRLPVDSLEVHGDVAVAEDLRGRIPF